MIKRTVQEWVNLIGLSGIIEKEKLRFKVSSNVSLIEIDSELISDFKNFKNEIFNPNETYLYFISFEFYKDDKKIQSSGLFELTNKIKRKEDMNIIIDDICRTCKTTNHNNIAIISITLL